jgi:hypothetical protein
MSESNDITFKVLFNAWMHRKELNVTRVLNLFQNEVSKTTVNEWRRGPKLPTHVMYCKHILKNIPEIAKAWPTYAQLLDAHPCIRPSRNTSVTPRTSPGKSAGDSCQACGSAVPADGLYPDGALCKECVDHITQRDSDLCGGKNKTPGKEAPLGDLAITVLARRVAALETWQKRVDLSFRQFDIVGKGLQQVVTVLLSWCHLT